MAKGWASSEKDLVRDGIGSVNSVQAWRFRVKGEIGTERQLPQTTLKKVAVGTERVGAYAERWE